jgi:hypothetical protein
LTLLVFIAANSGALLLAIAELAGRPLWQPLGFAIGSVIVVLAIGYKKPRWRTYLPIPWALSLVVAGFLLADGAPDDRRVLLGSAALTLCEVSIVTAMATLFSAFSSPFLTAVFTFSLFIVGRSADTLAHLPARVFGEALQRLGAALSRILPNLMLYVPPRPLLTGEQAGTSLSLYLLMALAHALAWSVGLLALASVIFRRRDFL